MNRHTSRHVTPTLRPQQPSPKLSPVSSQTRTQTTLTAVNRPISSLRSAFPSQSLSSSNTRSITHQHKSLSRPVNHTSRRLLSSSNDEAPIKTSIENEIMYIRFNRPKSYNAMNIEMGDQFTSIMKDLIKDNGETVKAVVLTGEGKAFSAGGDLSFLKARSLDTPQNNIREMLNFYNRFLIMRKIPVPVIAAINGPAVGAGACLTLAADVRIASTSATIGYAFTNLGLHPGMGCTHYLPRLINKQAASHLLLSGEIIDAGLAKTYGIIHDTVPAGETTEETNKALVDEATRLAQHYVKTYSVASFTLLKTLRSAEDTGLDSALLREAEAQALCFNGDAYKERLDKMINRKKK